MFYLLLPNELQHHGIKGQKWGIRRFQNKDGSLTNAGKSRLKTILSYPYKKISKKVSEKKAEKKAEKDQLRAYKKQYGKKSVTEMSDEELTKRLERARKEAQYIKFYNDAHPKQKSAGQKFIDELVKKTSEQTTNKIESYMKKMTNKLLDNNSNNVTSDSKSKNNVTSDSKSKNNVTSDGNSNDKAYSSNYVKEESTHSVSSYSNNRAKLSNYIKEESTHSVSSYSNNRANLTGRAYLDNFDYSEMNFHWGD